MTSTGQSPQAWKSTAATLYNPYLNVNQPSNLPRQQSSSVRTSSSHRQVRVPPESLVAGGGDRLKVTSSESQKRPKSQHFPSSHAAEEISLYVQQMIHYQSDVENDISNSERLKRSLSTANDQIMIRKRILSNKKQTGVSDYELDEFFTNTNDQISRMASKMFEREPTCHHHYSFPREKSSKSKTIKRQGLTLADMCNVASNVGDQMSQSKEKVGVEIIRGFRLPSARLIYDRSDYLTIEPSLLFGQQTPNERIHLNDVLKDDNYSKETMIEIVDTNGSDDRASKASRSYSKSATSTGSKMIELKDWRGKITQGNLPDVRSQSRRQRSESVESPQRPCTAASNLSKSRPESSDELIDDHQTDEDDEEEDIKISSSKLDNVRSAPVSSALKNPSPYHQRQRSYPLNVRIHETNIQQDHDQTNKTKESERMKTVQHNETLLDSNGLRPLNETKDGPLKIQEVILHPPIESILSTRTTPVHMHTRDIQRQDNHSPDLHTHKRNYKLIPSLSHQVYRTIPESSELSNSNQTNESFNQLTLPQLELLEHYDPMISEKIGAPFIPVQMLARPRDAQSSAKRTTEEIERDYPKKNGQPIFEIRSHHNLIDIAQTLQSSKLKRIPVERQTTFEIPENAEPVEESLHIKSIENPNRLTIELYTPPKQYSLIKQTSSSKLPSSQSDYLSILDQQSTIIDQSKVNEPIESNLSVINIRTHQEVDQGRPRKKVQQKRLTFPTTIVTNINSISPRQRPSKPQGRPIPSVFLTQDPEESNYSTSIYRHAKTNVDIKRVFKGFVSENLTRKLSADQRQKREEEQIAAKKIQQAYREHLERRDDIETRRPSTSEQRERDLHRRKILSGKRAQYVEHKLNDQTKINQENKQYQKLIDDTGPSVQIFGKFNQVEAQFSSKTLHRAATCIQRWWRGFIIRHRANSLKQEVSTFGSTWSQFILHYRDVIRRIQIMREVKHRQFHFNRDQAKDFLTTEKKLTTIYHTLAFNDQIDVEEIEHFFERCDLSATSNEIQQALEAVLQYYSKKKTNSLTKQMVFDVVYHIYPPLGTGIPSSRQSTWVRPIIDGEDETAIQGTPFLEPIDMNVVWKFLGKS